MTDLYAILGARQGDDLAALKRAFRRKARSIHPDLNPHDPGASRRFVELTAAFETLADPTRRALYDEFGVEGLDEGFDPVRARWARATRSAPPDDEEAGSWSERFGREFDLNSSSFRAAVERAVRDFRPFSGPEPPPPARGADREETVEVSLSEIARGATASVRAPDGAALAVRIPPGVADGEVLVVRGEGEPGRGGAPAGDLLLTVRTKAHPGVERDGLDLRAEVRVTMPEAILGASIPVTTPLGRLAMNLPAGSQSGATFRLRGAGLERDQERGDLFVTVRVRTPDRIDEGARRAAQQLAEAYSDPVRPSADDD